MIQNFCYKKIQMIKNNMSRKKYVININIKNILYIFINIV